jgi:CubicO group peptidase (beta-lactamase class C family)
VSTQQPDEKISSFLAERIAAGDFPSAVYVVGAGASAILADALGHAVRTESQTLPATLETIYDMASLTKPLVTGLLCARRIEGGELDLDAKVARVLPEFERADKREITLRQLLTHTSGLPPWRPLYITAGGDPAPCNRRRAARIRARRARALQRPRLYHSRLSVGKNDADIAGRPRASGNLRVFATAPHLHQS